MSGSGDPEALNALIPAVYDQLRLLARKQRRHNPDAVLNTTALVHEAYEGLAKNNKSFNDRKHFFRVAALAMRSILVDHARAVGREKRGAGAVHLPLDEERLMQTAPSEQLIALDDSLERLSMLDSRQAEVVSLRYFVGLTIPETAEVLGISEVTVKRSWQAARAWLLNSLEST